jgi:hypothetical protein
MHVARERTKNDISTCVRRLIRSAAGQGDQRVLGGVPVFSKASGLGLLQSHAAAASQVWLGEGADTSTADTNTAEVFDQDRREVQCTRCQCVPRL